MPPKTCKECGRPVHRSRCDPSHLERHRAASSEYRRTKRAELIPAPVRESICQMVAEGATVAEAADDTELRPGQIHGLAIAEPEFRSALDDALMAGRDPGLVHGRDSTYSRHRCRCPECREAHDQTRRGAKYQSESARWAAMARNRAVTLAEQQKLSSR